jgi:exodeoxyribonuclease-1
MRFDDEFIRYTNYRNLLDPYYREWANGNKRWDIIDVVRATYALRPEGIQWPMHEEGKPSFKLTDLTEANNLTHTSAHDALSDVEATISVAKLIKQAQPKLFEYCFKLRDKNHVKSLLNWSLLKPIVHVSSKIPAERGCLAIMLPLAIHPTNPNGVICFDLSQNPQDLFDLDVDEIQDRLYTPQAELPEGVERIPLKTIHINKSPIVCPLSVLKDVDFDRIKMDYLSNKKHLDMFKNNESMVAKVQNVFNQAFEDNSDDVDTQLYSGFFTPQDKSNFQSILKFSNDTFCEKSFQFKDSRAQELVWRFKARNFLQLLSNEESTRWKNEIKQRLKNRFNEDLELWFEKLNFLKQSSLNSQQLEILNMVNAYIKEKLLRLS